MSYYKFSLFNKEHLWLYISLYMIFPSLSLWGTIGYNKPRLNSFIYTIELGVNEELDYDLNDDFYLLLLLPKLVINAPSRLLLTPPSTDEEYYLFTNGSKGVF